MVGPIFKTFTIFSLQVFHKNINYSTNFKYRISKMVAKLINYGKRLEKRYGKFAELLKFL